MAVQTEGPIRRKENKDVLRVFEDAEAVEHKVWGERKQKGREDV